MRKTITIIVVFFVVLLIPILSFAHSGRTDAAGGHYDRQNGGYHYHHGYGAHQHPNGVCPYSSPKEEYTDTAPTPTKSYHNSNQYASKYVDAQKEISNYKATVNTLSAENEELTQKNERLTEFINDIVPKYNNLLRWAIIIGCVLLILYICLVVAHRKLKRRINASEFLMRVVRDKTKAESLIEGIKFEQEEIEKLKNELVPDNIEIGTDGLPREKNARPIDLWGESFTVFYSPHSRSYHTVNCPHIKVKYPIHIYEARKKYKPCNTCVPHEPDLSWYDAYLAAVQKIDRMTYETRSQFRDFK